MIQSQAKDEMCNLCHCFHNLGVNISFSFLPILVTLLDFRPQTTFSPCLLRSLTRCLGLWALWNSTAWWVPRTDVLSSCWACTVRGREGILANPGPICKISGGAPCSAELGEFSIGRDKLESAEPKQATLSPGFLYLAFSTFQKMSDISNI